MAFQGGQHAGPHLGCRQQIHFQHRPALPFQRREHAALERRDLEGVRLVRAAHLGDARAPEPAPMEEGRQACAALMPGFAQRPQGFPVPGIPQIRQAAAVLQGRTDQRTHMVWPSPREVAEALFRAKKDISVILQIGGSALQEVGHCRLRLAKKLEAYTDLIDGIVIDKSMWHGRELDPEELLLYLDAITRQTSWLQVGVAGGIGPDTMELVRPIIARYPKVSIDARSKLRSNGNPHDPVDWALVRSYVKQADQYLYRHEFDAVPV